MADAIASELKKLKLQDADGNPLSYKRHFPLDQSRRKVFVTGFPQCAEPAQVYEIIGESPTKEFTATVDTDGTVSLVEGSCQITYEDLTPSECVEYAFAEEPNVWRMAQLGRSALDEYKNSKFQSWHHMLKEPTCEAQFRRMLQIGPVIRIFDPHVFPTPEAFAANYRVTDDRTGKQIILPHPVCKLRAWNAAQQQYEAIDAQLAGAPGEADKEVWWNDQLQQLRDRHGGEYITALTGQGGAGQEVTSRSVVEPAPPENVSDKGTLCQCQICPFF
jgi:hypothetical protein